MVNSTYKERNFFSENIKFDKTLDTFVTMIKNYENISLRERNTFGIDVRCRRLVEFENEDDLRELFEDKAMANQEWAVLSGGSNILFTKDYQGVLLHPVSRGVEVVREDKGVVCVRAEAGVEWDDFVEWCVEQGLWGAENLSHIPGYVGAAPVQNIGAYGVEAKDIIESVELFDVESCGGRRLERNDCDFGYRDSIFKRSLKGKVIITAVNFVLSRTPSPNMGYGDLNDKVSELGGVTLRNIRTAVTQIRTSKLPDPAEIGNAGSFFKNPVVASVKAQALKEIYPSMPLYPAPLEGHSKLAAGWLIDQCGWRGKRVGRVGVHERQALVLVNYGGATGGEVLALVARIVEDVAQRFDIEIDMEVNIL